MLEGIRRPEYTGANRCLPCTAVNVAIAIAGSLLLSIASAPLAVVAFGASLFAIYFRGYLVPGTPELTKRYLPDSVLAYFEHGDGPTSTADPAADEEWETLEKLEYEREHAVDPEAFLREAGAVREETGEAGESNDAPDLTTTDAFETAVLDRAEQLAADGVRPSDLAAMFETDPESITFEDREYPAARIDSRVRPWPSDAALHVDVAANEVLAGRTDDWYDVPLEQRLDILAALRSFHDRCPDCGGAIEFDEAVVASCCRSYEVVTFACRDCRTRLVELPSDAAEGDLLADAQRN
ncbi:hypothetical protein GCM10028857_02830 [Salinarchaeum chitinilyticum]